LFKIPNSPHIVCVVLNVGALAAIVVVLVPCVVVIVLAGTPIVNCLNLDFLDLRIV